MHDKVGRIEIMIVCKDGVVLDWVPQALYTAAIFKHPRKGRACIEDGRLQSSVVLHNSADKFSE